MSLPCIVPAGWVEPPECELEDTSEQARLTGGDGRHGINRDEVWDDRSSVDTAFSDESEADRRERERRELLQKKKPHSHAGQGVDVPISERADLGHIVTGERSAMIK